MTALTVNSGSQRDRLSVDPVGVPSGTTTRFVLLIATVLAGSSIVFTTLYLDVPSKQAWFAQVYAECETQAASVFGKPIRTPEDAAEQTVALERYGNCVAPATLDLATWTGYGVVVLFGLALVLYWLHPWWIRRRGRLVELPIDDCPDLGKYLDNLCQQMGLARTPRWLVAPRASTTGGLTFGHPLRRYIQLDAGLVTLYATNRQAFRAVVLHELAHLRNRDVDKTYLTIGIWRSFVAVGLIPMVAFTIQPDLLYGPQHWGQFGVNGSWVDTSYVMLSLLTITILVYLTRNSILRVRETYADAVAAPAAGGALCEVIEQLRPLRGWSRLGTHPDKAWRTAVINDPTVMLRTKLWEPVGIGLAAGMLTTDLNLVLRNAFMPNLVLGSAAVALLVGPVTVGLFVLVMWRAAAATPGQHPPLQTWLLAPTALACGFVGGQMLSLDSSVAGGRDLTARDDISTLVITTLILIVGGLLVSGWTMSTARSALLTTGYRRWILPVVIAAIIIGTAPWFIWWFLHHLDLDGWTLSLRRPNPDGSIGWYRHLGAWTSVDLSGLAHLQSNPLLLPGLILLWLIPLLSATRRAATNFWEDRFSMRVGMTVVIGLVGGLIVVAVGVALSYAARVALPPTVRHYPGDTVDIDTISFASVYDNTYVTVSVFIQAAVAAVVVSYVRKYRPTLVLLAISVTATIATGGLIGVVLPFSQCIDLFGNGPSTQCFRVPEAGWLVTIMHSITVKGLILAVPAAFLSVGVSTLNRLRFGSLAGTSQSSTSIMTAHTQRRVAYTSVALGVLIAANLTVTVLGLPGAYNFWIS